MPTGDPRPRPSWKAVAGAQLRMLALLQRRDFVILGGILAVLVLMGLLGITRATVTGTGWPDSLPAFPVLGGPFLIIAALWPLGVWRRDSPERRGYFWSLPAPRGPHTLIRVAMGWILLMVACVAVMAVWLLLLQAAVLRFGGTNVTLAWWFAPLATATLAYLLMSCLAVALDGPVRAVLWIGLAWLSVRVGAEVARLQPLADLADRSAGSLLRALLGSIELSSSANALAETWPHFTVWFVVGVVGLVLAAFKRRDVR